MLLYDTERATVSPRESIRDPACNVKLRLKLSPGVKLAVFANDTTLVVYCESIEDIELSTMLSIGIAVAWIRSRQMELAHQKTEVVVVNKPQGMYAINLKRSPMRLAVVIDDKLIFASDKEYACERSSMLTMA